MTSIASDTGLAMVAPWLVCLSRSPEDDPCILESWV